MSAPPRQGNNHKELHETLAHGLYVEVLSASVWDEPEENLRALMEADNLDQQVCMADHEIHLIEKVQAAIQEAKKTKNTKDLWKATWDALSHGGQLGSFVEVK